MTTIIGYTDSITECECCGKTELKGTYCLDIDGTELYYGSTCAFKNHDINIENQKIAKSNFTKAQKNKMLYNTHIASLEIQKKERLENSFSVECEFLTGLAKRLYIQMEYEYNRVIILTAKKYKIVL